MSNHSPCMRRNLVADTAFVEPATIDRYGLVTVFPRTAGDGAFRATLDALVHRSKLQSALFDTLLPQLMPVFAPRMLAAGNQAGFFVRPVLVTVTSLFVDRCIRVLHRLRQLPSHALSVVAVEPVENVQWLSDLSQTWHLNQDLIQRIMGALGFSPTPVFEPAEYPEYPHEHRQRNLLFTPPRAGLAGRLTSGVARCYALWRRLPNRAARFQSLGFGADEFYLSRRGLLGPFGPIRPPAKAQLESGVLDSGLRRDLRDQVAEVVRSPFEALLCGLDQLAEPDQACRLSQAYANLLVDWFPVGFLEGLTANLKKFSETLPATSLVGVIGHDGTSNAGYFASAAARLSGATVVGVQHGGHYGYTDDMSLGAQFEYAHYDKMVTWGWTQIDGHLPKCETVPLPSPRLSERPLKFSRRDLAADRPDARDVLFLSNLWHRFPHASTCGQARVDFIDAITDSQEALMRALASVGLTVDHKPYSMRFVDLYAEHYRRLELAGGSGYRLVGSSQKGLSPALVKSCRIILWDQIGSGTLECLTSGIPTMVYWQRIYSREIAWARPLVAALEQWGVIHADPRQVATAIQEYLADPIGWMAHPSRREAIGAFCREYALTDVSWKHAWTQQLARWSDQGREHTRPRP